jgi:hypothetical protein
VGHIVLLRIKEDDYPGAIKIEDWPSWTMPVLKWAKSQGGIVGYAHSGWGLEPQSPTNDLPNYIVPKMDGIGANEYIVTVTKGLVDFYSAGDTPAPWELNMWYHTLNCGFKTRLSGETDFPCIFDERVGLGRSYFKPDGKLTYDNYVSAIQRGSSYVSDGKSHLIDFKVNGVEAGIKNSEVNLDRKQKVRITARAIADLSIYPDSAAIAIGHSELTKQPYWHIERARIQGSRKVRIELIVNGKPVDTAEMTADGKWNDIKFDYEVERSSWIALRVFPSSHTNPVFVYINKKPIQERRSAEWCRKAVDQCWDQKQANIRSSERAAAEAAYNEARKIYDQVIINSD